MSTITAPTKGVLRPFFPIIIRFFNQDSKRLNEVFKKYVLQAPFNANLLKELQLDGDLLSVKEAVYLHKLYNDPDSSSISNINKNGVALKDFQALMLESYKMSRKTCENDVPSERLKKSDAQIPAEELRKFEPPAKGDLSDEEVAKKLQEEFDREDSEKSSRISQDEEPIEEKVLRERQRSDYESPSRSNSKPDDESETSSNVCNISVGTKEPVSIINGVRQNTSSSFLPQKRMKYSEHDSVYNLGMSESFTLPSYAKNRTINCGMSSKVVLDEGCSHITVNGGMSSKVVIGSECSFITVNLGMSGRVIIGGNCSNIYLTPALSSSYQLGKNCKNIFLNGNKIA